MTSSSRNAEPPETINQIHLWPGIPGNLDDFQYLCRLIAHLLPGLPGAILEMDWDCLGDLCRVECVE